MNGINNLLEKYFNGLSSTEEEKVLKNYFKGTGILPEHEIYKPLFTAFNSEKQIKAPEIILPKKKNGRQISLRRTIILLAGSAAVALLAVTLSTFNPTQDINAEYVVIVNGKKITNQHKAREYAESMFGEAKKILEDSYQPFRDATNIKQELNAEKILREAEQKIEYIKTNHPQ